jgi:hypothetical protein
MNGAGYLRTSPEVTSATLSVAGVETFGLPLVMTWATFAPAEAILVAEVMVRSRVKATDRARIIRAAVAGELDVQTFLSVGRSMLAMGAGAPSRTSPGLKGLTRDEVLMAEQTAREALGEDGP